MGVENIGIVLLGLVVTFLVGAAGLILGAVAGALYILRGK